MWTSFFNALKSIFKTHKILKFFALCIIIGSILGSLIANIFIDIDEASNLANLIGDFFSNYTSNILNYDYSFFYCFIKNIKYFLIIWILGFTGLGGLFIFLILILKGISYGFTMTFFIIEFGLLGIFYACLFYFIQSIILIPLYFYVALKSCIYSSKKLYKYKNSSNLRKYLFVLVLCIILCLIVSFFDVYICPKIINLFL